MRGGWGGVAPEVEVVYHADEGENDAYLAYNGRACRHVLVHSLAEGACQPCAHVHDAARLQNTSKKHVYT